MKLINSEEDREFAENEINILKEIENRNVIKYLDSFAKRSTDDDGNIMIQYYIITNYYKVNFLIAFSNFKLPKVPSTLDLTYGLPNNCIRYLISVN